MRSSWWMWSVLVTCLEVSIPSRTVEGQTTTRATNPILVRVDGIPITEGDLQRQFLLRKVDPELQPKIRSEFLDELIDAKLIRKFLQDQKVSATTEEVESQLSQLMELLPKNAAGEVDWEKLGVTEKVLREELALPLMWRNYLIRTLTEDDVQKYFERYKDRYDGTMVRASQIYLKLEKNATKTEIDTGLKKLQGLRQRIMAGEVSFGEAAREYSESPSKDKGGDLGFFPYYGKMPEVLTSVAFHLKNGEISEPFVSRFGIHLLQMGGRKPGVLSLEDARREVQQALSNDLWSQTVKNLRVKAKIEWMK